MTVIILKYSVGDGYMKQINTFKADCLLQQNNEMFVQKQIAIINNILL